MPSDPLEPDRGPSRLALGVMLTAAVVGGLFLLVLLVSTCVFAGAEVH